ncbi:MAG: DnaJ-like cysteine-rich domain-containing protein [Acidobacteriaceae bacterium]
MTNLRQPVASAFTASLDSDDQHERPVDRLAAFSKAPRLGTLLWRLKYGNDATCYKTSLLLIAKQLTRPNEGRELIKKVCQIALDEWLADKCPQCGGSGQVMIREVVSECPNCAGTGMHRFKDVERARNLGMPLDRAKQWNKRISEAHDLISDMDRQVNRRTAIELERI